MTPDLNRAAEQLAAILVRENAALAALDLRGAAAMLADKQQAAAAFAAALPGARPPSAELARLLRDLAHENRERLELAVTIQRRIIGIIARAVRATAPAPRYGATGAMTAARPVAYTFSARA